MSQFILCKGYKEELKIKDLNVVKYPFKNRFLSSITDKLWDEKSRREIWTIENTSTLGVDCYFTDAQVYTNQNGNFIDTELYMILCTVINNSQEVIMWYSSDIDDISITTDKKEFFQIVEEGVRDSFCEVYIKYMNDSENQRE